MKNIFISCFVLLLGQTLLAQEQTQDSQSAVQVPMAIGYIYTGEERVVGPEISLEGALFNIGGKVVSLAGGITFGSDVKEANSDLETTVQSSLLVELANNLQIGAYINEPLSGFEKYAGSQGLAVQITRGCQQLVTDSACLFVRGAYGTNSFRAINVGLKAPVGPRR